MRRVPVADPGPKKPDRSAAINEPISDPATALIPSKRAPAAPANESSLDPMDGEGHVTLHHEDADDPADHTQYSGRDQRVLHQTREARCRIRHARDLRMVRLVVIWRTENDDPTADARHFDVRFVEPAENRRAQNLFRRADAVGAGSQVQHPVRECQHWVDVVRDEENGSAVAATALIDESAHLAWWFRSRLISGSSHNRIDGSETIA